MGKRATLIVPNADEVKDFSKQTKIIVEKTVSETIKDVEPSDEDAAKIRIGKRKAEAPPPDTPEVEPLPQLIFDLPKGAISNTAKSAYELSIEGGERPYEKLTSDDFRKTFEETKYQTARDMVNVDDGHKVTIKFNAAKDDAEPEENTEQYAVKSRMPDVVFKYDEDETLYNLINYIGKTYSGHYAKDEGLQTLDVWDALGSSVETCRDTAIKYLMRFGHKQGRNHKDLQKAIHYITLMMYFDKKRGTDT